MTNGVLKSALVCVTSAEVSTEAQPQKLADPVALRLCPLLSESGSVISCGCPTTVTSNLSHSYLL